MKIELKNNMVNNYSSVESVEHRLIELGITIQHYVICCTTDRYYTAIFYNCSEMDKAMIENLGFMVL